VGIVDIRPVREEEFESVLEVAGAAFGEEYSAEDADSYRAEFPFERSLAAFVDGKMASLSAVLSLELTLPGGVAVPMGGVTWIATLPTHRRQGLLTRLMAANFTDMIERGEIVSGLGASEGTIYGRFGYGPATTVTSFRVERAHACFATDCNPSPAGRLIMLDSNEAADVLPAVYESLRLRQPGAISRPSSLWRAYLADPPIQRGGATRMHHVAHEAAPGIVDGYVSYRVKAEFEGATALNAVHVAELLAADAGVYRALWGFVMGTDLCHTVSVERGRPDEPLRWLLADLRRFRFGESFDFLWLRLLDVPRALAARRYANPGRLVLEVADPFPAPRIDRFLLTAERGDAAAECSTTSAAPDLALDASMLGAVYLGGVSFATLAAAGRVLELTPGAIARADAMFFSACAPFCAVEF
jgi:predicted acetyltransferase